MIEQHDDSIAGFTLIEVIVAFLMLSMVLAGTALSISYSSRLYRRADEARLARSLAEQLIAEKLVRIPQQPDHEAGNQGDIHWSLSRKILADHFSPGGGSLVALDLDFSDRNGRLIDHYATVYVERQP